MAAAATRKRRVNLEKRGGKTRDGDVPDVINTLPALHQPTCQPPDYTLNVGTMVLANNDATPPHMDQGTDAETSELPQPYPLDSTVIMTQDKANVNPLFQPNFL
jgi:hypothetical protein